MLVGMGSLFVGVRVELSVSSEHSNEAAPFPCAIGFRLSAAFAPRKPLMKLDRRPRGGLVGRENVAWARALRRWSAVSEATQAKQIFITRSLTNSGAPTCGLWGSVALCHEGRRNWQASLKNPKFHTHR